MMSYSACHKSKATIHWVLLITGHTWTPNCNIYETTLWNVSEVVTGWWTMVDFGVEIN